MRIIKLIKKNIINVAKKLFIAKRQNINSAIKTSLAKPKVWSK